MSDGYYRSVRDPAEIARLKGCGVMDAAFRSAAENAQALAATDGAWVSVSGSFWTYDDFHKCVSAKLYYQSFTDYRHKQVGWVLESHFYTRHNSGGTRGFDVYQSAADALAAFDVALRAHQQESVDRENRIRREQEDRGAGNRRLGDEVRQALSNPARTQPAGHGAAPATPAAHLGRGFRRLMEDA